MSFELKKQKYYSGFTFKHVLPLTFSLHDFCLGFHFKIYGSFVNSFIVVVLLYELLYVGQIPSEDLL